MAVNSRWWTTPVLLAAATRTEVRRSQGTTHSGNDLNPRSSSLTPIDAMRVLGLPAEAGAMHC